MTSEETKQDKFNEQNNYNLPSTTTKIPYIEWTSRCEELLYFFGSHKAAGTLRENEFLDQSFKYCSALFARDGDILTIDNHRKQELCDSYPIRIILQKSFLHHIDSRDTNYDYLCRLLERARYARVHRRFVVPVIFLPNHACIARSSTLSTTGELLLNKATSVVSEALNYYPNSMESPMGHDLNACRAADIKLLNYFQIKFIADLMVEDKKKVGWGRYALTVTSSEKVDREHRYKHFKLSSIPYPGCEFFKRYRDNKHDGNRLVFEWDANIHDAKLNLMDGSEDEQEEDRGSDNDDREDTATQGALGMREDIDWTQYQEWDIIQLTQNYLRLITDYIESSFHNNNSEEELQQNGVLIHCISGWDRTPLFISLIRLSLWADGVIHCDLDCSEILYLTLSYDWLLFTHQFGNRLIKGEDIFHFTFYMLQYIISDRYSLFHHAPSAAANGTHTNHNHHYNNHTDGGSVGSEEHNHSKKGHILNKFKKLTQITKEQTRKIGKATKHSSNKLMNRLKSRSSTNILSKYISSNHFKINPNSASDASSSLSNNNNRQNTIEHTTQYTKESTATRLTPFSPPVHIQIPAPLGHKSKSMSMNHRSISSHHTAASNGYGGNTNTNLNTNPNTNGNNLSHSWEKKGCGPLSSNIRHSYIPTQRTPPSFTKNRNIINFNVNPPPNGSPLSTESPPTIASSKLIMPSPNPLQIVRTHPNNTIGKMRNQSWQFVDERNDSPMFQFISTPKSDPPPSTHSHSHHHHPYHSHHSHLHDAAPPELELNDEDDASSVSSGDIKINTKYSLSAPTSAKQPRRDHLDINARSNCLKFRDLVVNESPSPEVIAHPENKIMDMSMSKSRTETVQSVARCVIDDVIDSVITMSSQKYKFNTMQVAKSTPVTISDFLGLESLDGVRDSVYKSNEDHNEMQLNVMPELQQAESFEINEINVDQVLEPMVNRSDDDDGSNNEEDRHWRTTRSDRLLQVYSLFNKVYTQVMIINDPPTFYKQSNHASNEDECDHDGDNIDFVSSDKYLVGSDPYNNIATYLRSILPASLIGNAANYDEYVSDD